ncbi:FHA domain-containing protein [Ornithinibacillus sp. L9]|uniref:FHA domain-containing protein n=1 Tax=Ornithinibacillus caprae TaxID=2678566 RepID=A0A6N8FBK7_9BACI|nr:DUF6382 domain-containing protein [Ornithinibacillus caprae]MUK87042.1 FHA domain-containing protein [Ornithinibacillus caprae]
MGTIYNLGYDYVHQNGQSIVFKEKDGQSLSVNDLHSVQLKMMQSNRIPHMLALSVENIDLKTKLHFNINSKNRVSSYFRNNSTSMNDYYQLFLSIIKALEDCSSYMLNQQNFILRSDFIFVGEHASDIYLAYLPVKGIKKDSSVTEDIKQLLTDIAGEVEGLQGNEFKSILNYIKNPSFSLAGLKKLFLELISLRSNVNQFQPYDNYGTPNFEGDPGVQNNSASKSQNAVGQRPPTTEIDEVVPKSQKKKNKKAKKQLPALTSREKVYMFAGALLAIGLTWKMYDVYSTPAILGVCTVISILILFCLIVYAKFWRPGTPAVEIPVEEESVEEEKQNQMQRQQHPKQAPQFNSGVRTNVNNPLQPKQEQPTFVPNVHQGFSAHQSIAASSIDTTSLTLQNDDTVLLEDEANLDIQQADDQGVIPLLQRTSDDGKMNTVVINSNNFLIGRNADSVHFAEDATGVSRIHAEIIKIDATSYGLKDLGSKNGTKLNGNPLVPYKVYALNENDEIVLGKANYIFKWSSSE